MIIQRNYFPTVNFISKFVCNLLLHKMRVDLQVLSKFCTNSVEIFFDTRKSLTAFASSNVLQAINVLCSRNDNVLILTAIEFNALKLMQTLSNFN